nr:hypothetical protein [Tanacetum cinerariifolium]
MLLAKKDKDEQVLLAEDQAWIESSSDSDQEINTNMVFMAQTEKVLSDSEASSSSADEKISDVSYYLSESKSKSEFETSEYYDNSTNYGLFVNNDDDQEIFHDAIESASENFIENHIDSQKDYDKSDVDHNDYKEKEHLVDKKQIADQQVLYDKMSFQLVELDKHVRDLKNIVLEKDFKISELEECQTSSLKPYVLNVILEKIIIDLKDEVVNILEKEKVNLETVEYLKSKGVESSETVSFESENQSENDCHVVEKQCGNMKSSKTVHMIMPSKDNLYNGRKGIGFENPSYFEKAKDLRPTLYDEKVIGLGVSTLNKNVKRYSRKDLLACNNSHLGETRSAFISNDAMNISCDSRMNDLLDDNNFFIFNDESVRIFAVSKMPFRKKPRDSMNVRSKSNSNKSLPRTVHKWLPKLQPLAEPIAKWFPRVKRQIDKISKTPNSLGPIYKWVPKVC